MKRKVLIVIAVLVVVNVATLNFAFAQGQSGWGDFIPCDGVTNTCDFDDLIRLINNILGFLVRISFPLAIVTFSWAGFILMTSGGNPGKKDEAKKMLTKVVIGFAILLAAWVIVRTVVNVLLDPSFTLPIVL